MNSQRIDYHIHTHRCGHATGDMEEYVEKAFEIGLAEIAFTDHIPMEHPVLEEYCMNRDELDGYVNEVLHLKDVWKDRITVHLGVEADFAEGHEEYVQGILEEYPFDVVLGSIHVMDGWGVDNEKYIHKYEQGNIEEIFFDVA